MNAIKNRAHGLRINWKPEAILLTVLVLLLALGSASTSADETRSADPILPRSFQKARLGMGIGELVRTYPEAAKIQPLRTQLNRTVVLAPKDPALRRIESRFHQGSLYEIQIFYNPDRLPRGATGLLSRLKELYGQPAAEGLGDNDLEKGILWVNKTVWNDGVTRVALVERRKFVDGVESREIVLIMTDLALERLHEEATAEAQRREEEAIPIPLPDRNPRLKQTARTAHEPRA
ncbi:MAG: hypothetical protein C4294_12075 [Nitrospiraceae bacterium]